MSENGTKPERDAFGALYSVRTGMKTDRAREQNGDRTTKMTRKKDDFWIKFGQIFNKRLGSKIDQIRASLEDFELEFNKRLEAYI